MKKKTNIQRDLMNIRIKHSIKKQLQKTAKEQGLTLSKYIAKMGDEQKVKNIVKILEQVNKQLLKNTKQKNTQLAVDEKQFSLNYALNLAKGILETVTPKAKGTEAILNATFKAMRKHKQ